MATEPQRTRRWTRWRYTVGKFAQSILDPGDHPYYVGRERKSLPRGAYGACIQWHRLATAQTRGLAVQIAKMLRRQAP